MSPTKPSSRSSPHLPVWRHDYDAVLSETDTRALFKCVEIAEAAILTRRDDLWASSRHRSELQVLEQALANLGVIKRERLKFL